MFGPTPILADLARSWPDKGTVIDLQESLHAFELGRVRQPVQVNLVFPVTKERREGDPPPWKG